MKLRELTFEQFENEAKNLGVTLPIEQTEVWSRYEATVPSRSPWGCFAIDDEGKTVAFVSFTDYETHGYHYLRAKHAPVWVDTPSDADETAAMQAVKDLVKTKGGKKAFARLCVKADLPACQPTLSTVPYDTTVVVDVTGGDEAILSRMKNRGRRDVRKALREAPVTCADETDKAAASFKEYYEVMLETTERDGFHTAPCGDYENMLRILGPEHARVFAGRDADGRVVTWSLMTINGDRAVYYYAASRSGEGRAFATDKLMYFALCELGRRGCSCCDLMGIGSDFAPSVKNLNMFKTKFCEDVVSIAPDRDLPIQNLFYKLLVSGRKLLRRG